MCCFHAFLFGVKWIDAGVFASLPFAISSLQLSEDKAAITAVAETLKADVTLQNSR